MQIRLVNAGDLDALFDANEAFNGPGCTTKEQMLKGLCNNPQETVCVAMVDGALAGFLCAQQVHSLCYGTDHASIEELFVYDRYRRRGIGMALMQYAQALFNERGIFTFSLCTGKDNLAAQALYEKLGYVADDVRYIKQ